MTSTSAPCTQCEGTCGSLGAAGRGAWARHDTLAREQAVGALNRLLDMCAQVRGVHGRRGVRLCAARAAKAPHADAGAAGALAAARHARASGADDAPRVALHTAWRAAVRALRVARPGGARRRAQAAGRESIMRMQCLVPVPHTAREEAAHITCPPTCAGGGAAERGAGGGAHHLDRGPLAWRLSGRQRWARAGRGSRLHLRRLRCGACRKGEVGRSSAWDCPRTRRGAAGRAVRAAGPVEAASHAETTVMQLVQAAMLTAQVRGREDAHSLRKGRRHRTLQETCSSTCSPCRWRASRTCTPGAGSGTPTPRPRPPRPRPPSPLPPPCPPRGPTDPSCWGAAWRTWRTWSTGSTARRRTASASCSLLVRAARAAQRPRAALVPPHAACGRPRWTASPA